MGWGELERAVKGISSSKRIYFGREEKPSLKVKNQLQA